MPTFLSDPSSSFTFLMLVAAVVAVGIWYRYRDKTSRNRMIAVLVVVGAVLVIAQASDSPREKAERRVQQMCEAATKQDVEGFLKHVSDSFEVNGANKAQLRKAPAWNYVTQYKPKIDAFNYQKNLFQEISPTEIEIVFTSKATAPDGFLMRYTRARFVKDSDGEWRMKSVKFYDPADGGMNREVPIPGFPN